VTLVLIVLLHTAISTVVMSPAFGAATVPLAGDIAVALIAGGGGGYVCAAAARSEHGWHAAVLAALLLGIGTGMILRAGGEELLLRIVFAVAGPVGVLLGSAVRGASY